MSKYKKTLIKKWGKYNSIMEPLTGIEPVTSPLPWVRSTNWAIVAKYVILWLAI